MEFEGFGDWIEIFRGGKQIDSTGREHDGDAVIEKALATFDAATHEPPLVIGHPQTNAPAYGWVQALKKVGNILFAKFKDVVPEFEAIARQGLFKKRSASFYPDGRLRHVGFLGAAPPAVKGLADLKFEDDAESICFEHNIESKAPKTIKKEDKAMTFKDFMEIFKFWKTVEENPDLEMPLLKAKAAPEPGKESPSFSEADIEAAKKEAADAEREKVTAEFAEKQLMAQREARNQEISTWCEALVSEGRVIPAWVKMGLKEFCLKLDAENVIEFSEESKVTALDWFKNFVNELPKVVVFKELAKRDMTPADDLNILSQQIMVRDKIEFAEAWKKAGAERPDLFESWLIKPVEK